MTKCEFCGKRAQAQMCKSCSKSYDEAGTGDGSVMDAMVWAARRARDAERERNRKLAQRHLDDLARKGE